MVNVTNGKIIRLLVDDEPLDLRYGQVHRHQRVLDLQSGTLTREVALARRARRSRCAATRLVSLTQRAVAAIYEVEVEDQALDRRAAVGAGGERAAAHALGRDPRVEAALLDPLVAEQHVAATTRRDARPPAPAHAGLRMAAAMDHEVRGPEGTKITSEASEDIGRLTVSWPAGARHRAALVKYLAYGWSSRRSLPAVRDQVAGGLTAASYTGWEGLAQRAAPFLDQFWTEADVEIEGDDELQQAVRVAAVPRPAGRARGLSAGRSRRRG